MNPICPRTNQVCFLCYTVCQKTADSVQPLMPIEEPKENPLENIVDTFRSITDVVSGSTNFDDEASISISIPIE